MGGTGEFRPYMDCLILDVCFFVPVVEFFFLGGGVGGTKLKTFYLPKKHLQVVSE